MMATFREIEFENNSPKVCYSGQLIRGRVNVYFPVDTHVKAIYITFFGHGFCRWIKDIAGKEITGSKTYLDVRLDLIPDSVNADTIVPAGNNNYPFEIQLRPRIPTSYEGTHGYIRYITTLHIHRFTAKIDRLQETFTVIKALNLNNSPSYRMPTEVRKFTRFNYVGFFFCCKTPDLEIFGRLPVRGYCPGQTMNLKLDVNNKSFQDVLYFLVQFIQEITYTASDGQTKLERILLTEKQASGCPADRNGLQTIRVNISVPSLPPTNFSADICGCRYMFRIKARTSIFHQDPTFEIPVIIGTYPISNELYSSANEARRNVNQTTSLTPSLGEYLNMSNSSINSCDLPPYPDTDPPTYEEAMRSSDSTENQNTNFLPKYPTYRRQTTYSNEEP